MTMMHHRNLRPICLALSAVAALLVSASDAQAWDYGDWECNGEPYTWPAETVSVYRNTTSIPDYWDRYYAYKNAVESFDREVTGAPIEYVFGGKESDSTVEIGDGRNEVAVLSRTMLDGANGVTFPSDYESCIPVTDSGGDWRELDIMVASDMNFDKASGNGEEMGNDFSSPGYGRAVMLHEFGHGLGFGHASALGMPTALSIMHTHAPIPLRAGNTEHVDLMPDDLKQLRSLYPSLSSLFVTNIAGSLQKHTFGGIVNVETSSSTVESCPYNSTTFKYTILNLSSSSKTVAVRYYLSTSSSNFSGNDIYMKHYTGIVVPAYGSLYVEDVVPFSSAVSLGQEYYKYISIDKSNDVAEIDETDNVIRMRQKVRIRTSC